MSFLVSAALVVSIRRPFGLGGGTESEPGVWAGVRLIVHEPVLRVLITASVVSLLGMGMVGIASYPLSIRLGGGTEGYGALEALLGGGGLIGAAIAARMLSTGRAPLIVTITFAVSGLGLLLAGLAPVLAVALAGMAIAGTGHGLGDVANRTLVQARTDDARSSRVFAAQDGAAHAAYSAATVVGGLIVATVGYTRRSSLQAAAASQRRWLQAGCSGVGESPDVAEPLEERFAPLDGIAAVILSVVGVAVLQGKAHECPPTPPRAGAPVLPGLTSSTGARL